ncbi:MAG TPA: ABC transporter substrate-binding protein, partial [Acidimicrobiales bacterium]|nr:ABC transporter substrate-binding protein [Acidimicrobiales bacterium]
MRLFQKGGWAIAIRPRWILRSTLFAAILLGAVAPGVALGAGSSATPQPGGNVTTSAHGITTLDPVAPGASATNNGISAEILGGLFSTSGIGAATIQPELATAYRFSRQGRSITITLRKGVRFSDGTPFNSRAVIWNLRRTATSNAYDAALLATVAKMTPSGSNDVTIAFSTPNYSFIQTCATSAICDMASPSAYARLGASAFAAAPVGAGPFRVVSADAAQVTLARNPTYWDARHVYLAHWTIVDLGDDPNSSYQSLIQDSIQGVAFDGIWTAPAVLFQAKRNHNLTTRSTPNMNYGFLPLNVSKPPFSDQRAREALDFCTNRTAIAKNISSNYATPAYVLAGASSAYLPKPGGVRGAETLMPYKNDSVQGSLLVATLGGLSFQMDVASGTQSEAVANALATQWLGCGIHAQVVIESRAQLNAVISSGTYQAAYLIVPGTTNPTSSIALQAPASPLTTFSDPRLAALFQSLSATDSPSKLTSLWHQIWFQENTDA